MEDVEDIQYSIEGLGIHKRNQPVQIPSSV